MRKSLAVLALALAGIASSAAAQSCGGVYTIARGDSLSRIALALYEDAGKWTALHQSNISDIGEDPDRILVGQRLWVSCIAGLPQGLDPGLVQVVETLDAVPEPDTASEVAEPVEVAAAQDGVRKIRLVTEDRLAPLTDPDEGLVVDVMQAALREVVGEDGYELFRINDPAAHLDPLLSENMMDVAIAWSKPDCAAAPTDTLCTDFQYSEPAFEMLVLLFHDVERPVPFASDADLTGRVLCRPEGYATHMLDENGRNWLAAGKVTLKRPVDLDSCFEMVMKGEADAVVINEFTGRTALSRMGLEGRIKPVEGRPVAVVTLHAVVAKANPNAVELIGVIDRGLRQIRETGEFQTILAAHLTRFWAGL